MESLQLFVGGFQRDIGEAVLRYFIFTTITANDFGIGCNLFALVSVEIALADGQIADAVTVNSSILSITDKTGQVAISLDLG